MKQLAIVVLLTATISLPAVAKDKAVQFVSDPPGATVSANGLASCVTPCEIVFPSYYFGTKYTAASAHSTDPIAVRFTKSGYEPVELEITTDLIPWRNFAGVELYEYRLIRSTQIPVRLSPISGRLSPVRSGSVSISTPDVFGWFDEVLGPGTRLIDVVVTARAYENAITALRKARGSNTSTRQGFSVLDTNYYPTTFRLGTWINAQTSDDAIPSVFYWEGEVLSDTTPAMHFYMTERAYRETISIVGDSILSQEVQPTRRAAVSPQAYSDDYVHIAPENNVTAPTTGGAVYPKQSGSRFVEVLRAMSSAAANGMATYYEISREQRAEAAIQRQADAAESMAYSARQQTWELQQIHMAIDQANQAKAIQYIQQQGQQYQRLLSRYRTGYWP